MLRASVHRNCRSVRHPFVDKVDAGHRPSPDRKARKVPRSELLTMLHVLGTIAWLGAGIGLLVLHWLALRARDHAGLATVVRQSQTLGTWLFAPASLVTAASGIALVATEAAFRFTDLARLLAAERSVTLVNTFDICVLLVVVWAMFAKPVL